MNMYKQDVYFFNQSIYLVGYRGQMCFSLCIYMGSWFMIKPAACCWKLRYPVTLVLLAVAE